MPSARGQPLFILHFAYHCHFQIDEFRDISNPKKRTQNAVITKKHRLWPVLVSTSKILEQKLHRNLELTRRARITRGIARRADYPKRRGPGRAEKSSKVGIREIRMIEQVKSLDT